MYIVGDEELSKLELQYEKRFGEEFYAPMYQNSDKRKEVIRECMQTGVPFNPFSDPEFDPDAWY